MKQSIVWAYFDEVGEGNLCMPKIVRTSGMTIFSHLNSPHKDQYSYITGEQVVSHSSTTSVRTKSVVSFSCPLRLELVVRDVLVSLQLPRLSITLAASSCK